MNLPPSLINASANASSGVIASKWKIPSPPSSSASGNGIGKLPLLRPFLILLSIFSFALDVLKVCIFFWECSKIKKRWLIPPLSLYFLLSRQDELDFRHWRYLLLEGFLRLETYPRKDAFQ